MATLLDFDFAYSDNLPTYTHLSPHNCNYNTRHRLKMTSSIPLEDEIDYSDEGSETGEADEAFKAVPAPNSFSNQEPRQTETAIPIYGVQTSTARSTIETEEPGNGAQISGAGVDNLIVDGDREDEQHLRQRRLPLNRARSKTPPLDDYTAEAGGIDTAMNNVGLGTVNAPIAEAEPTVRTTTAGPASNNALVRGRPKVHQSEAKCTNPDCGAKGHWFHQCPIANADGVLFGCPWCEPPTHHIGECLQHSVAIELS